jgi:hypothetical protein
MRRRAGGEQMLAKIDLTDAFATEVAVVDPSGDIEYANKK